MAQPPDFFGAGPLEVVWGKGRQGKPLEWRKVGPGGIGVQRACVCYGRAGAESQPRTSILTQAPNSLFSVGGCVGQMRLHPPPPADPPVVLTRVPVTLDFKLEPSASPQRRLFIKWEGKAPNY